MQSCSYNNAGILFYLLCQHNSQMLMLACYAQNYASIICKALVLACICNFGPRAHGLTIYTYT